ncbi:hypothetical protein H6F90_03170 [Trichocoleus sp. FACHB-591]|uniref:hypothetical protein n=1 Tax=Trichocoleus sp. FACHB-591 TaxID=2692872 RepID=UPI001682822F|nr:hypothetical protein [Trichocoleus sp. FACHB-591]MBD2094152.1 hypothetical protein [Trichocoleus sp. FACHB-591]
MASEQQVRQYLAYWFQLGKKVVIDNGQTALLPEPVIQGDRYSQEFEDCWQLVRAPESGDCHLEGTHQTIAELLSPAWDIMGCARCSMPVPLPIIGTPDLECPCIDLPNWPNMEVPLPRAPISSQSRLIEIRDRLMKSQRQRATAEDNESRAS